MRLAIGMLPFTLFFLSCGNLGPPNPEEIFRRASPSVYVVSVMDTFSSRPARFGSGVAVAKDLIVTNRHVLGGPQPRTGSVLVSRGKVAWQAFPLHYDRSADLAVLVVPGLTAAVASLAAPTSLQAGQPVFAIGAPQGLELTITEGLLSAVRQLGKEEGGEMLQVSAAISPGSSGGGLFDRRGRLIGITTSFIKSAQGLSFAIPPEVIDAEMRATGYAYSRAFAIGLANAQAGNFAKAEGLLRESVALQSDFCEGWLALGRLEVEHEPTAPALQRATSVCSDRSEAWTSLGQALERQASALEGQVMVGMSSPTPDIDRRVRDLRTQATAAFETGLRLSPDDPSVWMDLGDTLHELEESERACQAYREVLRLVPGHLKAMTQLCIVLGNTKAAIEQCTEVVRFAQLQPESPDRTYALAQGWLVLAGSLEKIGDFQRAREARAKQQLWQQIFLELSRRGPDPEFVRRRNARADAVRPLLPILEERLGR